MQISPAAAPPASTSDIIDVTMQNFMPEVVQASMQAPVLLYFTAPWCGPCKQFGPTLEKVVKQAGGKLKLARVDIDKNKQIAAQFGVQSVPTVFVLFEGQPVDAFQGAVPEGELKKYINKLGIDVGGEAVDEALVQAEVIKAEIAAGHLEEAGKMLAAVAEALRANEHIVSARSALELARQAGKGGADLARLEENIRKNPKDQQSRFDLAVQYFAHQRQEEAIDALLMIFQKDRGWNDDAARKQLVQFFDALGHAHPLTVQGRKKLSSMLFA